MDKRRSSSALKILYVDDDENVRKFMARFLTALNCRVQAASSGKEAIKLIQQQRFDLVMTDLEMPEMDGRDLAKAAKAWQPHCPVILLTGCKAQLELKAEKLNGIDAIIQKPASLDTLRMEILKWVPASKLPPI